MEPRVALSSGFSQWLDEVFSPSKVSPKAPLDAFQSSLRRTGVQVEHLKAVRDHGRVGTSAARPIQVLSDLRWSDFVEEKVIALTPLGSAVLDKWIAFDIDNNNDLDEVTRCSVLISEALDLRSPKWVRAYESWRQLVSIQPAAYWIIEEPKWRLVAPTFLNYEDSRGYNALSALLAASGGDLPLHDEWVKWVAEATARAKELQDLRDEVKSKHSSIDLDVLDADLLRANRLRDTLHNLVKRGKERIGGRQPFCIAMELYRVAHEEPKAFPQALIDWNIPYA